MLEDALASGGPTTLRGWRATRRVRYGAADRCQGRRSNAPRSTSWWGASGGCSAGATRRSAPGNARSPPARGWARGPSWRAPAPFSAERSMPRPAGRCRSRRTPDRGEHGVRRARPAVGRQPARRRGFFRPRRVTECHDRQGQRSERGVCDQAWMATGSATGASGRPTPPRPRRRSPPGAAPSGRGVRHRPPIIGCQPRR